VIIWSLFTTNRHVHTPGHAQCFVKAGLLACRHPSPVMPSRARAQWRWTRVVRLTAAGAAPDWHAMAIAHVTGFPFHPPADEQEGTIHL
jgi:hypothetical protein